MELKVADLYKEQFSRLVYRGFKSFRCVFQKPQDFQQGDKDTMVRYAMFNLKVVLLRFKVTGTLSSLVQKCIPTGLGLNNG
jgi:hypothetical protein